MLDTFRKSKEKKKKFHESGGPAHVSGVKGGAVIMKKRKPTTNLGLPRKRKTITRVPKCSRRREGRTLTQKRSSKGQGPGTKKVEGPKGD